jgi:hypothetical protein
MYCTSLIVSEVEERDLEFGKTFIHVTRLERTDDGDLAEVQSSKTSNSLFGTINILI